ncbi:uncharacterized protein LOC131947051 [Physella acuta]|uniref:uncharacterized protein LOC131947051 n=1 Tax=Physella acuta TaxID=109671 RepID=UPI0027DC15DB|nr:uncharacterized protein LOC131947051 [Physella acuta]
MREVKDNCVVLKDISAPVFNLILKEIYTGVDILTVDNLIQVWRAVHQLQIPFMVKFCEDFAMSSLSSYTWEAIHQTAYLLDSESVILGLHTYMLRNFDLVCITPTFLKLPYEKVKEFVASQDLVVSSEDVVLESVQKWTEWDLSNEKKQKKCKKHKQKIGTANTISDEQRSDMRKQKFTDLLKLVRTCLVNPTVLMNIYNSKLISKNNDARDIIVNALSYRVLDNRHGHWPSSAIHRECSEYSNFGVYACDNGQFKVLKMSNKKRHTVIYDNSNLRYNVKLVAFDSEMYAIGLDAVVNVARRRCRMFVLCDERWTQLIDMPSNDVLLAAHGKFIYIFDRINREVYNINPKSVTLKLIIYNEFPENASVRHASVFENFILLFCAETNNGVAETAIYRNSIPSSVWTRLDNLDGPADNIITFRNDTDCFILQANGNLWKISNVESRRKIDFTFILKLWGQCNLLQGAIPYNDKLVIAFGSHRTLPMKNWLPSVPEYFTRIEQIVFDDIVSNFIPIVLPNEYLRDY